ncbi:cytochrome c oxidase assembly protein [Streptomyces chromofuscus]|uniref:Cytochrome c oxidase assembly protein n=1 Tax=Streptomyces chromofuscus TaxID=42881 RepID=A0A7M2T640_STRCW|nr:cytochrome c oxidase assembly protein [Streptomyces chromofuscus]QOV44062.1 cytochrome c oxidase assembly protein [Streptomyces chromofuscus]GGT05915.1 hypothetical protein GCM10010254_27920 [Streptomyces chromofuscus]
MDHGPHAPQNPADGGALAVLLLAPTLLLCTGAYLRLAHQARRRNPARGWSRWRTAGFLAGLALLALALLPPVGARAHADFRLHMTQHLLVGMYAPLALVLGAPLTLLLRTLPTARGRQLSALLHSRPARALVHPATAWLLSTGSLVALYFTPLYNATTTFPAGHWLLHAHFLLAGCLFAHVVAGPDPAPARPGVRARLVWLGAAIAVHAVVSQLMYGGFWVDVRAPAAEVRTAAEIMYYGGDIAELLLAAALITTWRPEPRTRRAPPRPGGPSEHAPPRRPAEHAPPGRPSEHVPPGHLADQRTVCRVSGPEPGNRHVGTDTTAGGGRER